jgi:hypothetical protein
LPVLGGVLINSLFGGDYHHPPTGDSMRTQNGLKVLEKHDFQRWCPSFYATQPKSDVSDQYTFLNSRDIAAMLYRDRWVPVYARESAARDKSNKGFTKHIIRYANKDLVLNGERIELVMVGSHNRSAAFQFYAGVFRMICLNGMIAMTSDFGHFRVRHVGDIEAQVMAAVKGISSSAGKIAAQMSDFKEIELTPNEQGAFASRAHKLIYKEPNTAPIKPLQLLVPKRTADAVGGVWSSKTPRRDLWTTFNVVQENTMKGGLRGFNAAGKKTKTRRIRSIDKDVKLNSALWDLTEKVATLKKAS